LEDLRVMGTSPESLWPFRSNMPGVRWPAILAPGQSAAIAVLHQLEQSQWLSPEQLLAHQLVQADAVLQHAWNSAPAYRRLWRGHYEPDRPLSYEQFRRLPLLSRRQLQDDFKTLSSSDVPKMHGPVQEGRTSGSTGAPVRFLTTPVVSFYWNVFTLRDHLWHRRDFSRKLAIIRNETRKETAANWGMATHGVVATGPAVSHTLSADAGEHLDWLLAERPDYLFTYPSLVADIARLSLDRGVQLPSLLEVRTLSEALAPEVRQLCAQAWGVPLTDLYSASEVGYMALQCPQHEHYHVQSEGVLLEVLDDHGNPCGPGEVGRVVVTALHNFATPLVRYDIGDFAEVGVHCPCGRGLPVLKRVMGRVRNTLIAADGKRYWPLFGLRDLTGKVPVRQYQFVQTTTESIEARLVVDRPLTEAEETLLVTRVRDTLPVPMRLELRYVDQLARSASGKFEDFYSEVALSRPEYRGPIGER